MADEKRTITVTCERFDPGSDESPYRQSYQVPFSEGLSVLNVLTYIFEQIDPTLGFFNNCDRGVCGRCTMMVNGRPALSCTTLVTGDLELAPLAGRPRLRDLLVDL